MNHDYIALQKFLDWTAGTTTLSESVMHALVKEKVYSIYLYLYLEIVSICTFMVKH
jgi:hypothetical protein